MILDKETRLAENQAVTASAATTNYYDNGSAKDLGVAGKPLQGMVTVLEDVDAAGAATVDFALESDDNAGFSSPKKMVTSAPIGKADLKAGRRIFLPIPVGFAERFVRGYFTIATGPLTAGKFHFDIVDGAELPKAYPGK